MTATGLLVDFGGVLTTSVTASFEAFGAALGGPPGLVADLLAHDPPATRLLVEHECGRIGPEEFEAGIAACLALRGHDVPAHGLVARLQAGMRPDPEMLAALAGLRAAGTPVAIVTNSLGRDCYAGFDLPALADAVVVSGELGVRKPARRIFTVACERLGLAPSACVLVDDVAINLDGAARLGIAGVLHTGARSTVAELGERFGLRTARPLRDT